MHVFDRVDLPHALAWQGDGHLVDGYKVHYGDKYCRCQLLVSVEPGRASRWMSALKIPDVGRMFGELLVRSHDGQSLMQREAVTPLDVARISTLHRMQVLQPTGYGIPVVHEHNLGVLVPLVAADVLHERRRVILICC